MFEKLHTVFIGIFSKYSDNKNIEFKYWQEIEANYSHKNRYYHNLNHLNTMLDELQAVKTQIADWDSLVFSVFYHDIIYSSIAKNNEEESAKKAKINLTAINLPSHQINAIHQQILATKSHLKTDDLDTNFLLDSDLAILGKSWADYLEYTRCIRKEYARYPDFLYNPGRKKVLQHFLSFNELFKTSYFKEKYEKQAILNITKEIELLNTY